MNIGLIEFARGKDKKKRKRRLNNKFAKQMLVGKTNRLGSALEKKGRLLPSARNADPGNLSKPLASAIGTGAGYVGRGVEKTGSFLRRLRLSKNK